MSSLLTARVRTRSGMTQVFVREFKQRDRGHIINIGSIAGREAYPGGSIYNATKFAVAGFTSSLMKELVATKIRVSEVQPGCASVLRLSNTI